MSPLLKKSSRRKVWEEVWGTRAVSGEDGGKLGGFLNAEANEIAGDWKKKN
jgi:hypothetical protein